jgi:hypothetical protein
LIRITEEVQALRDIVEAIQSALDRRRSGNSMGEKSDGGDEITRRFCQAIHEPLLAVRSELAALEARISRVPIEDITESRWKAMRHSVSWGLGEDETKECIDRLERCKGTLSLAIASQNS